MNTIMMDGKATGFMISEEEVIGEDLFLSEFRDWLMNGLGVLWLVADTSQCINFLAHNGDSYETVTVNATDAYWSYPSAN